MHTEVPRVVHESETQRQHVRWSIPARVEMGGSVYDVKNLSAGGVSVLGVIGQYPAGRRLSLRLSFPFTDFSLSLSLAAEARHHSAASQELGCAFLDLTAGQIAVLQRVLGAFAAGESLAAGDLLAVAARDNFTKPRAPRLAMIGPDLRRQWPGLAVIALVGMAVISFIGMNIHRGLFRVAAETAWVEPAPAESLDPWISAEAEAAQAARVHEGARAEVRVFGVSMPYAARVVGAQMGAPGADGRRRVTLRIETERPMPATLAGRPATAVVHAGPPR